VAAADADHLQLAEPGDQPRGRRPGPHARHGDSRGHRLRQDAEPASDRDRLRREGRTHAHHRWRQQPADALVLSHGADEPADRHGPAVHARLRDDRADGRRRARHGAAEHQPGVRHPGPAVHSLLGPAVPQQRRRGALAHAAGSHAGHGWLTATESSTPPFFTTIPLASSWYTFYMSTHIQGILWDMDGIIVDSEAQWPTEMTKFFKGHDKEYTAEDASILIGSSSQKWVQYIQERCELDASWTYERVTEEIRGRMRNWYKTECQPIPGSIELMKALHERGLKMAIASGAHLPTIEIVVERFGLAQYLDAWVSGEEVTNPKPAPDVFIEAARRLGVDPEHCAGIEDSPNGTRALQAGGMRSIAIPHHLLGDHPDYQLADVLKESVAEVTVADFLGTPAA